MGFMREFFIVVLIVSLMLSVSAVVAEDNISDDLSGDCDLETVSEDDSPIGESETPVLTAEDDFDSVQNMIDSAKVGDTIYLEGKTFKGNGKTIMVNKSLTIVGGFKDTSNVYATLDGEKQSRIMVVDANVTLKGITFINGNAADSGDGLYADGGAIFVENNNNLHVENCTFSNNTAEDIGGAISENYLASFSCDGCVFSGNSASYGGAMAGGSAVGCVFSGNSADEGGAMDGGSAVGCVFSGNSANGLGGAMDHGSAVGCVFSGNSASYGGGAMYEGSAVDCVFSGNSANGLGGAMDGGSADSCIFKTGEDTISSGTGTFDPSLTVFNYTSSYKSGDRLKFSFTAHNGMVLANRNVTIEIYQNNTLLGTYHCSGGESLPVDLDLGDYVVVCRADDYGIDPVNATLTVTKISTRISSNPKVVTYDSGKYLIVSLTDGKGNPLSNFTLSVDFNGVKVRFTDGNGKVRISTRNLAPKTYNVKITFAGGKYYFKSSDEFKFTVKKLKSKIIAKKKTFKKSLKTKKYTVTLKSGKKPIKKVKVILKIKKKTFKAKTNKKGKATFKIKKLKKGTYTAKVTFKGNKYYKKSSKKVKITVK